MNSSILSNKQQYAVVVLSVMLSLMVVWAAANGATTISANVSTGGTLTVTGASTLSSATLSSTLDVTGATTLTSATMSTTLGVTGLSTLTGGYVSAASSTVSGNFNSSGKITAGASSTPIYTLGATSAATTTLALHSTSGTKGGCIEIEGANGTIYRITATTTAHALYLEVGACLAAGQ